MSPAPASSQPAEQRQSGTQLRASAAHTTPLPLVAAPEQSGAIPVGTVDWGAAHDASRLRHLVAEHIDFVWRSLRALGVPTADCDDGCQKVWCVVARKLGSIEPGKERSFIFSVVVRVASDMRRSAARSDVAPLEHDLVCSAPDAEELYDRQRARELLEQLLSHMPWEQRVAFVMFEVEGLGLQEIAEALAVPRGTVASRLRLARDSFNRALARHQQRQQHSAQVAHSVPRDAVLSVPSGVATLRPGFGGAR